jgi:hypothetical protein
MSMISPDRFPNDPMSTQGVNAWHDESLGDQVYSADGIYHGQNIITLGPNGGMQWQRARPGTQGTFHQSGSDYPGNTGAGYTVG